MSRSPHHTLPHDDSKDLRVDERSDWHTIKSLWPYIWRSKYRVMFAFVALTLAKLSNLGIPIVLKKIIDGMTPNPTVQTALIVPIALLVAYGALRISMTMFNELREVVFSVCPKMPHARFHYRYSTRCTIYPSNFTSAAKRVD